MSLPTTLSVRLVAGVVAGAVLDPGGELHVLRVTPLGDAPPTVSITITFDRPVAGSLDRSVDPKSIFGLTLRATARCPAMVEWFDPAVAPTSQCDWQRWDRTVLPAAFAEWAQETGVPAAADGGATHPDATGANDGFHILSPLDGDVYRIPPGVDRRYSTVALRVAEGGGGGIRWFVDGREQRARGGPRWLASIESRRDRRAASGRRSRFASSEIGLISP